MSNLPHNFEAEQAVLGAILVNNGVLERLLPFLRPQHFADPLHGALYDEMATLHAHGRPVGWATLREWIEGDFDWRSAGGHRYLAGLVRVAPPPPEAAKFAGMVIELYNQRATAIGDAQ